jgi:hypothetical protein
MNLSDMLPPFLTVDSGQPDLVIPLEVTVADFSSKR